MKPSNTIFVSPKYIEEKERKIADLSKKVERLQEQLDIVTEQRNDIHIDKQVLQEQLDEANEVIKKYATGTFKMRCRKYEGKAVGTDIITGEPVSEDLYGGYYYSDIPMSNKTDVAKKYLEKWGVK